MQSPGLLFRHHSRLISIAAFFVVLFVMSELTGIRQKITIEYVRHLFEAHIVIAFFSFCVFFTLANLIQIPGIIFLAGAVFTFGQEMGGMFTYGAASLSCVFCFLIIRSVGHDSLRSIKFKWAKKILSQIDYYPIRSVMALRVLFQTAPALNYALALSGVKFRDHFFGTLLGLPLPITLYCIFFDQIAQKLS